MRITPCGSCGKPALWFVITIADRSHRGPDTRLPTAQPKADRRVLAPLVRVVNDLVGPPLVDGHVQGGEDQTRLQMRFHRPPDHASTPDIEHDGEIEGACP